MEEEVQEVQQTSSQSSKEEGQKQSSKLIWIVVPIIVVIVGILIFFLMPGSSDVSESSGSSEVSIKILEKSFKIDETGKPNAIFILADVVAGSCNLAYNDVLIQRKSVIPENSRFSLTAQLDNRLNLGLWSICCDELDNFDIKGDTTICKNE